MFAYIACRLLSFGLPTRRRSIMGSRPQTSSTSCVNGARTFIGKIDDALLPIEWADGKGSVMRFEKNGSTGLARIEAHEPEAELFARAEQVDLADKVFHDAFARRNEAQIAYLRAPSTVTRAALEAAKTAEAVAQEILDTEIGWLARTRATTVTGLKLKASYASTTGKLADSCRGRTINHASVADLGILERIPAQDLERR